MVTRSGGGNYSLENKLGEDTYFVGGLFVHLCVPSLISSISWLTVQRFLPLDSPPLILIGVILATYPFPSKAVEDPEQSIPARLPLDARRKAPSRCKESKTSWARYKLPFFMYDLVAPYLYHLRLTPQHLSNTQQHTPASSVI